MTVAGVLVTTLWLSLIIGARYLLVAGAVHAWLWRGKGTGVRLSATRPSARLIRHEIRYSLISTPIYALPAAIVLLFALALFAVSARIWLPGDMAAPAPIA